MNSFVTTVLQGINFSSDLLLEKCEILIAAFADKSVTTTEKQQIRANHKQPTEVGHILYFDCKTIE